MKTLAFQMAQTVSLFTTERTEVQQVRLVGLFLFITAILLAMAAAATQTTHIRVSQLDSAPQQVPGDAPIADPTNGGQTLPTNQFRSIPIVYPLTLVGVLGLALWFAPSIVLPDRGKGRKSRRRRRRR